METFLKVGGRRGRAGGPGIDFDELGVAEVVELLDDPNTHMEAVVRDFGDRNPQEDPVIHFYEHFLAAYDKKQKVSRGVFYTPRPVVSYIVRSVDELLRTEFGLADGLADTTTWGEMAKRHEKLEIPEGVSPEQDFVQVLDPATGTGTFLVEVIDVIHRTLVTKWKGQGHGKKKSDALWNEYVPRHLLTRLHGYELLMAPYAIAHLKVGLKLYETGYRFGSDERARIFLTNALEPPGVGQIELDFLPALAHEAEVVNTIKRKQRFTSVIGNPPYSGLSANMGPWIDGLLKGRLPDGTRTASYYHVDGEPLGERKVWLQDDYVKFIRLSQWLLDRSGAGVHGYISNHGYVDNPTFRGMRFALLQSFQKMCILDLHGNPKKKEVPPSGGRDVNVFDIQQGVAIGLFVKAPSVGGGISHADLWGEREHKYRWLTHHGVGNADWLHVDPAAPFFLFEPFDSSSAGTYHDWTPINEIMPLNVTGIVTARDALVTDLDKEALRSRISELRSTALSDERIREKYLGRTRSKKYERGDSRGWKLPEARRRLRNDKDWEQRYTSVLYRPFDIREMYYVPWMVDWPRMDAMPHMLVGHNRGLVTRRAMVGEGSRYFFASKLPISDGLIRSDNRGSESLFPLYLYPRIGKPHESLFNVWPKGKGDRTPNLDSTFVDRLSTSVGLRFVSDGRGDLFESLGPEDVLAYIYGIFHSSGYRKRYEEQLKLDFPRVPLPGNRAVFRDLASAGQDVLAMHLLESPKLDRPITEYLGRRAPEVEKVSWTKSTVWLDKAQTIGFKGVREDVWNFHIGGYQVCEKWLKDRKDRTLSKDDIAHYQRIVVALSETIQLMKEIDEVIETHGGWPDAFQLARERPAKDRLPMVAEGPGKPTTRGRDPRG
jgi:predicted helicase